MYRTGPLAAISYQTDRVCTQRQANTSTEQFPRGDGGGGGVVVVIGF